MTEKADFPLEQANQKLQQEYQRVRWKDWHKAFKLIENCYKPI